MAVKSQGTKLEIQFTGETYTTIGEVNSISGPSFGEVTTIETTHLASTSRTYIAGIGGGGSLSFELNYDPDNVTHQPLIALVQSPAVKTFRVTFADSTPTIYTFDGILKSFEPNVGSVEDKLSASCEVQISGPITIS